LKVLHVGVGNSGLAKRFASRLAAIDGITIQPSELELARQLGLGNYRVLLANKYAPDSRERLGSRYHFIVDNNPSAFACCRQHFFTMLRNYRRMLWPGGRLLSDRWGLERTVTENDPRWALTWDDWVVLGEQVGLVAERLTSHVFALRSDGGSPAPRARRYARRLAAVLQVW
jgi:hypothetical protein